MAIFFTKQTIEEAVLRELPEAQQVFLRQVKENKQVQTVWAEHSEKCEAAQEGINLLEQKETKEDIANMYGKSSLSFGCACQQLFFTVDDKGNITTKGDTQTESTKQREHATYLPEEKKTTSLYSSRTF